MKSKFLSAIEKLKNRDEFLLKIIYVAINNDGARYFFDVEGSVPTGNISNYYFDHSGTVRPNRGDSRLMIQQRGKKIMIRGVINGQQLLNKLINGYATVVDKKGEVFIKTKPGSGVKKSKPGKGLVFSLDSGKEDDPYAQLGLLPKKAVPDDTPGGEGVEDKKLTKNRAQVLQFLKKFKLDKYFDNFVDNGYESLDFILAISSDEELKEINIPAADIPKLKEALERLQKAKGKKKVSDEFEILGDDEVETEGN